MWIVSTSSSVADFCLSLVGRYARESVSARTISLPCLKQILRSYDCNLSSNLCSLFGAEASGLLTIETSGL